MDAKIAVLSGDGIGPEVMDSALRVLDAVGEKYGHRFERLEGLIGGIAIDQTGSPLPSETIELCEASDAVLLAAVGGPKWDDPSAKVRPEQGLLGIRKRFQLFANLRPIKVYPVLAEHAPLRADLLANVDILIVRELTGGLYFGPRKEADGGQEAYDTMLYTRPEIERVAHVAFRAAQKRRQRITSVDKANVLASMRLWRSVVTEVHGDYSDVELEHLLVDACTMHLLTRPASFDVILTGNMFGDILSDEASVLAGSLGMLASASLGNGKFGLYEPVHGSAPDIVGQGKANPIGMILSAAMMLRFSLELDREADAVERAVDLALEAGLRTADIVGHNKEWVAATDMTTRIIERID